MSRDLSLLSPEFRGAVGRVLAACYELGVEIRPYVTVRDPSEQARLWRQSRSIEEITQAIHSLESNGAPFLAQVLRSVGPQNGDHVTDALPGLSWHQWGEAVDCYWQVGGQANWSTRDKVRLADGREMNGYRLYGEIAVAQGLTSGGFWSTPVDWVHIQQRKEAVERLYGWPQIDQEMRKRFGEAGGLASAATPAIEDKFVRVKGDKLYVNGKPFRFVGVNIRGLVHYGAQYSHGPGMPWPMVSMDPAVHAAPQRAQLIEAYSFGARVVRVFLAHQLAETDEIIRQLKGLLGTIKDLGYNDLYLLPALTNFYESVPFHVRGDNAEVRDDHKFYRDGILNVEWYRGGHQNYYRPFVERIVSEFKDEPNILAWEVGNELAIGNVLGISDRAKAELVKDFMRHIAHIIKAIDPEHLVTTGMTSTSKAWMRTGSNGDDDNDFRRSLYEPFDFVTIHYPRDAANLFGSNVDDVKLAQNLLDSPKPFIIEEDLVLQKGFPPHIPDSDRGGDSCDHRPLCFQHHLEEWLGKQDDCGRGASGYMIWGFDKAGVNDDDPGGIGPKNPPDWGELRNLFSTFAEKLAK
jgi:peptidoglycan L-alanyl-D-glutamate endopeptidase CwlK